MPSLALIDVDNLVRPSGAIRLLSWPDGAPAEQITVEDGNLDAWEQLDRLSALPGALGVIANVDWERLAARRELQGRSLSSAHDLAYLCAYELPFDGNLSLDVLQSLALALIRWLEGLPADILAQSCSLIRELAFAPHFTNRRLGLLEAWLGLEFGPLGAPVSGHVELDQFAPKLGGGKSPGRQELPTDILERVFAAHGAFEQAFEGYEERPQQIEMARAVEAALARKRNLVVEAGTGVGKSIAYLLPLAIHSARHNKLCLVSTNTINLQHQLIEQDILHLRQMLPSLELQVTLIKGREHYLCLKRLADTWLSNSPPARQRRERLLEYGSEGLMWLIRLLGDSSRHGARELSAIPGPPGLGAEAAARLPRAIDCGYRTCLGDRCEHRKRCVYFARRDEALRSHIAITNHALVFALHNTEGNEQDNLATRASAVVFDEAHNLESAITNQYTAEVSHDLPIELGNRLLELLQHEKLRPRLLLDPADAPEGQRELLRGIQSSAGSVAEWIKAGAGVRAQILSLLEQASAKGAVDQRDSSQLSAATAEGPQARVLEILESLAARLHAVVSRLSGLASAMFSAFGSEDSELYLDDDALQMDLKALALDCAGCANTLESWRPSDPRAIAWFNCEMRGAEAQWEFKSAPLNTGVIFQDFAASKESVILSSATLSVGGKFDYLQASLGFDPPAIERCDWLQLSSPFDYARQCMLLVATGMDAPTGERRQQYLEQLEGMLDSIAGIFEKGVLVLFNSYRDIKAIAGELSFREWSGRLLVQGQDGTREQIAREFKQRGDRVLLATRSFWEGFDVAGEALSCVVMAKLPFANFKDPIHAGRQRALNEARRSSFNEYSLPQAVMLLKQGFGRLIRSRRDRGCVFLLDSRVATSSYGRIFVDSLPGPAKFIGKPDDCLQTAAAFMATEVPGRFAG